MLLNKKDRDTIRKRLKEIEKLLQIADKKRDYLKD